jgi:hypothetical protein
MGAYPETGPLSGNVPPITIEDFVMPGVALAVAAPSRAADADDNVAMAAPTQHAIRASVLFMLPLSLPEPGLACAYSDVLEGIL